MFVVLLKLKKIGKFSLSLVDQKPNCQWPPTCLTLDVVRTVFIFFGVLSYEYNQTLIDTADAKGFVFRLLLF